MWRDREEDRTVDATPGYDLNTCLLWLSSDQSSLCQAPLPAGNFSTHVTPSLNTSPFCFSFSIPLLLFFKNNFLSICWSRSNLPILGSISGLLSKCVTHLLCVAMLSLTAFSHGISPGPLVLSVSRAVGLPEDITERNEGRWGKGQMEMSERRKAEDCRHARQVQTLPQSAPDCNCYSLLFFSFPSRF